MLDLLISIIYFSRRSFNLQLQCHSSFKNFKFFIPSSVKDKSVKFIKDKINFNNVFVFYQIAKVYKMPNLLKLIYSYTVSHFTTISKTKNFLELDFNFVYKILSDSNLNVTSELEVLKAADAWFTCMSKERTKFARSLFLQVRYPFF